MEVMRAGRSFATLAVVMALVLALGMLVACGGDDDASTASTVDHC